MAREVHVKRRGREVPGPFEAEPRAIDEFVEQQVSSTEAFMTGMRIWDRPGCVTLVMESERE